jgi:MFS transporter, ACS family, DAL5 transporter family protein
MSCSNEPPPLPTLCTHHCLQVPGVDLDRGNISQANSAHFLKHLNHTTNDISTLVTHWRRLDFLLLYFPQLLSTRIGPDRCGLLSNRRMRLLCHRMNGFSYRSTISGRCIWSLVTGSQFWFSGSSFLVTHFFVGLFQGGFIPVRSSLLSSP